MLLFHGSKGMTDLGVLPKGLQPDFAPQRSPRSSPNIARRSSGSSAPEAQAVLQEPQECPIVWSHIPIYTYTYILDIFIYVYHALCMYCFYNCTVAYTPQ